MKKVDIIKNLVMKVDDGGYVVLVKEDALIEAKFLNHRVKYDIDKVETIVLDESTSIVQLSVTSAVVHNTTLDEMIYMKYEWLSEEILDKIIEILLKI